MKTNLISMSLLQLKFRQIKFHGPAHINLAHGIQHDIMQFLIT